MNIKTTFQIIFVLLGITTMSRADWFADKFQKLFESSDELKTLANQITEFSKPYVENMSYTDLIKFYADYQNLKVVLLFKLGEVIVNQIHEGNSDEKFLEKVNEVKNQVQSEDYYKRLEKIFGESKLQGLFTKITDQIKAYALKLRENGSLPK